MYKILITTKYSVNSTGVSVHTLVIEFDDIASANKALEQISEHGQRTMYTTQTAIALF